MQLTEHQLSSLFRITFRPLQNARELIYWRLERIIESYTSSRDPSFKFKLTTRKANTMAGETLKTLSVVSPGRVKASDLNAEFVLRQTANTLMC